MTNEEVSKLDDLTLCLEFVKAQRQMLHLMHCTKCRRHKGPEETLQIGLDFNVLRCEVARRKTPVHYTIVPDSQPAEPAEIKQASVYETPYSSN